MTIVCWDGKSIAADRQATCSDMRRQTIKLVRGRNGDVFSWTGTESGGRALAQWYLDGADTKKWPAMQNGQDWTRLLVASGGVVLEYEQNPFPTIHKKPFLAWGSGRDFAMGAMAMGANARQAVLIASRYSVGCGMGVTVMKLK